jgi:hypothetical protein
MDEEKLVLEQGKIYYLDYGNNTQVIGRYKDTDTCQHNFYDLLHYWNGYERSIEQLKSLITFLTGRVF